VKLGIQSKQADGRIYVINVNIVCLRMN